MKFSFTFLVIINGIVKCLQARAQRRQTTYEKYENFISNPTPEARLLLFPEEKNASTSTSTSKISQKGPIVLQQRAGSDKKEKLAYLTDSTDSTDSLSGRSDSDTESSSPNSLYTLTNKDKDD